MKKKLSLLVVLIIAFGLVSCKKRPTVTPVGLGLSFSAVCDYNKSKLRMDCIINKTHQINLYFSDNTKSITLIYDEQNITISQDELKYKLPISEFNISKPTQLLYYVFKDIQKNPTLTKQSNNVYFINGEAGDFNYILYIASTGLPLKLIEKNNNIQINFSNQKIIS